jgi:hypothetical protein
MSSGADTEEDGERVSEGNKVGSKERVSVRFKKEVRLMK